MGNFQSKQSQDLWRTYLIEIGAGTMSYALLYCYIVWKSYKKGLSPKDCLSLTTNIGSTVNGVFGTVASLWFFIDKKWKEPVTGNPGSTGHIMSFITSYFVADMALPILFYLKYSSQIVPRRYSVIFHHIIMGSMMFLINYPEPYYGWIILAICPTLGELSTVFLNAQWFGKFFKCQKLAKYAKIGFVISWFIVRIPLFLFVLWWLIYYWKRIWQEMPLRVAIVSVAVTVGLLLLNIPWTIIIILKIIKATSKNKIVAPKTAHGISISLDLTKIHQDIGKKAPLGDIEESPLKDINK
eukprot:247292_1